jgi:predicted SprT family Zn-dependent metalloprotease
VCDKNVIAHTLVRETKKIKPADADYNIIMMTIIYLRGQKVHENRMHIKNKTVVSNRKCYTNGHRVMR